MAVHVVTVIHRPQGVEEEAGGKENQGEYKETIKKRGKRRFQNTIKKKCNFDYI
jgi:hypothetical protein